MAHSACRSLLVSLHCSGCCTRTQEEEERPQQTAAAAVAAVTVGARATAPRVWRSWDVDDAPNRQDDERRGPTRPSRPPAPAGGGRGGGGGEGGGAGGLLSLGLTAGAVLISVAAIGKLGRVINAMSSVQGPPGHPASTHLPGCFA